VRRRRLGQPSQQVAAAAIVAGLLTRLELESWVGGDRMPRYSTDIVRRKSTIVGPVGRLLFDALAGRVDDLTRGRPKPEETRKQERVNLELPPFYGCSWEWCATCLGLAAVSADEARY